MWAEFDVELHGDAPSLEVPWPGYVELSEGIISATDIPEAKDLALRTALEQLNSSALLTAKCDLWSTSELDQEELSLGFQHKQVCYIDCMFRDPVLRSDFDRCERAMRGWVQRLRPLEAEEAMAAFVLRACYPFGIMGFYWTLYVGGYDTSPECAYSNWAAALELVVQTVISTS